MVAGRSDDPLDSKAFIDGIPENYNVTALWSADIINPSVEQIVLRVMERRNHAYPDYLHRLQDKMADDEIAGHGQAGDRDALKDLLKERRRVRPLL